MRKKFHKNNQITDISLETINNLLNDDFSCIKHVRKSVHIILLPSYIGNELNGVKAVLESWKNRYIKKLNGILIAYKNVNFVESQSLIIADQPQVHQNIIADFYVLQPSVGVILRGNVNRISETHVGCILFGGINASITLTNPHPKHFDKYAVIDKDLLFEISRVEVQRRVVRIHGTITEKCLKLLKKERKQAKSSNSDQDS